MDERNQQLDGRQIWFFLMVLCHFQQYFSYIVAVSFIGGGTGENHRPSTNHRQTLSHNVVHLPWAGSEPTTSVVIGTGCIGSCKSNYHMIKATTAPCEFNPANGEVYSMQLYVIKFVSDLRQTGGSLVSSTNKTDATI